MSTLTLDDITATRLLSGNRRIHHMVRSQVCAYWRKLAHDTAIDAYGYADIGCTWHTKARITVTIRFPDLRRRDVSNLYPYVAKPLVDGLIDARILPDDDDLHIIGPDMRRDPERGPHRIVISIEDTP
jgi:hypothetical protein